MYYYGTTQNPYWNISYGINASPQSNAWNMNNGGLSSSGSSSNNNDNADTDVFTGFELLSHPYPVSIIVTVVMFLLSHKVNFCYNRVSPQLLCLLQIHISCSYLMCVHCNKQYWEACQALHNMHSKWLDAGVTLAAFHMQSTTYDSIRPISFGSNPEVTTTRGSPYSNPYRAKKINNDNSQVLDNESSHRLNGGGTSHHDTTDHPTIDATITSDTGFSNNEAQATPTPNRTFLDYRKLSLRKRGGNKKKKTKVDLLSINAESQPVEPLRYPSQTINNELNRTPQVPDYYPQRSKTIPSVPSLFLEQGAHFVSLLSAVALTTLRCEDTDSMKAPLVEFIPNLEWPHYNSDNDADMKLYGYKKKCCGIVQTINYMLDMSRTKYKRSKYNACRPLSVVGGVSQNEIDMLQRARGQSAKMALVVFWWNEFIIREQLHGSLGNVGPPIVSRLQQYTSDGHLWYNAARKMSYIPYPFPLAQMATIFVILSAFIMPTLMLSKTEIWYGFILNYLTVLLFAGLNEISKVRGDVEGGVSIMLLDCL